jgi:hypothetical protein
LEDVAGSTPVGTTIKSKMENKIEIKKLVGNGNMAKLSHVIEGNMYYNVQTEDGLYQFPIAGFEKESHQTFTMKTVTLPSGDIKVEYVPIKGYVHRVSDDIGTTTFNAEIKAIELMRWIRKAIENNEIFKIG